ncbi:hypothetical protein DFJ74DRAFT_262577 [Hyaloraphidium curvatum]|nr:hypothetical protein DFJ74DRAFT_262577 [Hyaloraphidium curvatum]
MSAVLSWIDEHIVQPIVADSQLAAWGTVGSVGVVAAWTYSAWTKAQDRRQWDRERFEVPIYPPTVSPTRSTARAGPQPWAPVDWTASVQQASAAGHSSSMSLASMTTQLFRNDDIKALRRVVRAQFRNAEELGLPGKVIVVVGPDSNCTLANRMSRFATGFPFLHGRTLGMPLTQYWAAQTARVWGKTAPVEDAQHKAVACTSFANYLDNNPEMLGLEAMAPSDPERFTSGRVDLGSWTSGDPRIWLSTVAAVDPKTGLFRFLRDILNKIVSLIVGSSSFGSFFAGDNNSSGSLSFSPVIARAQEMPFDTPRDHNIILAALHAELDAITRRWLPAGGYSSALMLFEGVDAGLVGEGGSGGGTAARRTFELWWKHMRGMALMGRSGGRAKGKVAELVVVSCCPVTGATALRHILPTVVREDALIFGFGDLGKDEARELWEERVSGTMSAATAGALKSADVFNAVYEVFGGRAHDLVSFAGHLLADDAVQLLGDSKQALAVIRDAIACFPDVGPTKRFLERVLADSLPEAPSAESVVIEMADYNVDNLKDPVGPFPLFRGPSGNPWQPTWTRTEAFAAIQCIAESGFATYREVLAQIAAVSDVRRASVAVDSLVDNGVLAFRPASGQYVDFPGNRREDCFTFGRPMVAWVARTMLEGKELVGDL